MKLLNQRKSSSVRKLHYVNFHTFFVERLAGKSYPRGKYCSRCKIPGNFLANGGFSVSVAASIKMMDFQFWENEAVSFEVNDTGGVRGAHQGRWRGVIRPMLEWKTELKSEVN